MYGMLNKLKKKKNFQRMKIALTHLKKIIDKNK